MPAGMLGQGAKPTEGSTMDRRSFLQGMLSLAAGAGALLAARNVDAAPLAAPLDPQAPTLEADIAGATPDGTPVETAHSSSHSHRDYHRSHHHKDRRHKDR